MTKWFIKNKKGNVKKISEEFNISEVISRLLINREIVDEDSIRSFINPNLEGLHDAHSMKDIGEAVKIIKIKIKSKCKIRVIGDYDVDGIVSTYILYTALKKCGADVDYDIPDRVKDGYGINNSMIEMANTDKIDTIITCDNGISAADTVKYAKELGMTVIITDHHNIPFENDKNDDIKYIIPPADAVVDPKRKDCKYIFKGLCGAGVVLKFIEVLYEKMDINEKECINFIPLAAIATICDVVDLIDENRIIVKNGLEMLNDNINNIGLKALIEQTGIQNKKISVYHIGFILGPCLNASGRLDSAKKGLKLLLTNNEKEAVSLAEELYKMNCERKDMTQNGVEKAIELIENTDIKNDKVFVLYIPDIHESIAGIIAGRIREVYNVPTIILTKTEKCIKGSARSIEKYNMFEELSACRDLLLNFGGHPMAAGMSLEFENVEPLRKRLNQITRLKKEDLIPKICVDMRLPLNSINYDLVNELSIMEPFGKANPKPLFGEKNVKIICGRILGRNQNVLRLKLLCQNSKYLNGIYFGDIQKFENEVTEKFGTDELNKLYNGEDNDIYMDIAFYPDINEFNGNTSIQVIIENFR